MIKRVFGEHRNPARSRPLSARDPLRRETPVYESAGLEIFSAGFNLSRRERRSRKKSHYFEWILSFSESLRFSLSLIGSESHNSFFFSVKALSPCCAERIYLWYEKEEVLSEENLRATMRPYCSRCENFFLKTPLTFVFPRHSTVLEGLAPNLPLSSPSSTLRLNVLTSESVYSTWNTVEEGLKELLPQFQHLFRTGLTWAEPEVDELESILRGQEAGRVFVGELTGFLNSREEEVRKQYPSNVIDCYPVKV